MLTFKDGKETFRASDGGDTLTIQIAGDCCPWQSAIEPIARGESASILQAIQPTLDACDLSIVQFEAPLTESETPIAKSGPNLKCPPSSLDFVKAAGFDVALLANNHTGDYGPDPVMETLRRMEAAGIRTVGAGANLEDAQRPLWMDIKGFRVAILNVAEHEFGTAEKNRAGAAPLEPLENIATLRRMADEADIVLAVLHGGNETNPHPSPRVMRICRAFAEAGADAVVNIHTHCPQGIELWEGAPIIYSPGNFFFPYDEKKRPFDPANFWWTGYLPRISFDRHGAFALDVTPCRFRSEPVPRIDPLPAVEETRFFRYLAELSAPLGDADEIQRYFDGWCALMGPWQVAGIRDGAAPWPVDLRDREAVRALLPLRNRFTCEAHSELIANYLRLVEEFRTEEAAGYIPKIKALQNADFSSPET